MPRHTIATLFSTAALLISADAYAQVTLTSVNTYTPSNNSTIAYGFKPTNVINFDNRAKGAASFTTGGATFSGNGFVENGTAPFAYQAPRGDTSNYLADGNMKAFADNFETIRFSQAHGKLGVYWGSVDQYNSLTFFLGGKEVGSLTGGDIAAASNGAFAIATSGSYKGNSFYSDLASNGSLAGQKDASAYVNFSGVFDQVVLRTTQPNFEIDNLAVGGVPEPSTWAMLLIGFGGLAMLARQKVGPKASVRATT